MTLRKQLTVLSVLLVLLAGCAGGGSPGGSEGPQTVRIALPAMAAGSLDIYVAEAEGFFEDNGLNVETILTPGPSATIAAMSGGSAEVGTPFAEQALAAMEQGAPLSIFAGQINQIQATVVGQKGMTGVDELRGQKVTSSSVDDILTLMMMSLLDKEGLTEGDYDTIVTPSSEQRFQSLQTGAVAAAMLVAPRDFQALADGYSKLAEISEPGVFLAHIGTDKFLAEQPDAAARYVRAIQQAIEWIIDPANEQRILEILVDRTEITLDLAKSTYDLYLGSNAFAENAEIDEELLDVPLQLLKETGRVFDDPPDPKKYIDRSALDAAADIDG